MKSFNQFVNERRGDYAIYHKTYSDATQEAYDLAEREGYEVDGDAWFQKVNTGPRKPSSGKTVSHNIPLLKNGKETRKALNFQVYNMDNKSYELNAYIS